MKKILLWVLVLSIICFSPNSLFAQNGDKLIAYYFHGNFRCASCYAIERYTKESLNDNFKDQLGSGELVIKVVNVEKKGNEHFVQDYKLYTKSVVLSLIKDGKEVKWKNLDKVWHFLGNKDKFYNYIKSETQKFLDELPKDNQS